MYNQSEITTYLKKINYQGDNSVNLHNLRQLQYCHLLRIPYENLSAMNGSPVLLDESSLYDKIISHDRGGYCFELQGLFYYLLKSLGYQVEQFAGRFMDEPGHIQMRRHRVLVMTLEGKRYVCDVGVRSESSRFPLELVEDVIQSDCVGDYYYKKDPFYGWVQMQRLKGKDWKTILGFTEEKQIDDDYVMPSFYCEKHPDSTFNKFMKISIFTDKANLNIVGNEYRVFAEGRIQERRQIQNDTEARRILAEHFHIQVPPDYKKLLLEHT